MSDYKDDYDDSTGTEPVHEDCDDAHLCSICGDEVWNDEGGVACNDRVCQVCARWWAHQGSQSRM